MLGDPEERIRPCMLARRFGLFGPKATLAILQECRPYLGSISREHLTHRLKKNSTARSAGLILGIFLAAALNGSVVASGNSEFKFPICKNKIHPCCRMALAHSFLHVIVAECSSQIELQVFADPHENPLLYNVPKPLLPTGNSTSLAMLCNSILATSSEIKLVTTIAASKHYEKWAFENNFSPNNLYLQDSSEFIDAVDFMLAENHKEMDALYVSANLFSLDFIRLASQIDVYLQPSSRKIVAIAVPGNLHMEMRSILDTYNSNSNESICDYLTRLDTVSIHNIPESGGFGWSSDNVTLEEYKRIWRFYDIDLNSRHLVSDSMTIRKRSFARVGLVGNPSDGFGGKTLAATIENFYVEVVLVPNRNLNDGKVTISPNNLLDPIEFTSMDSCEMICCKNGYYGAVRLFLAVIVLFSNFKASLGAINRTGFTIYYATTIPRQVGLAGSSALVTCLLKALVEHFHIPAHLFSLEAQANMALAAERDELGISAGYADRVVQMFGGLLFMDFNPSCILKTGKGIYESMPISILPSLWLGNFKITVAFVRKPKESGSVHSKIKSRFDKGDPIVHAAMQMFAQYAQQSKDALLEGDMDRFFELMNINFEERRKLYTDAVIGDSSLRMVDIARQFGHSAKLSGSGGCVIGGCTTSKNNRQLKRELESHGFVFCVIRWGSN